MSIDDYVGYVNEFAYAGLGYNAGMGSGVTQTLAGGPTESVGGDFRGLATGAYATNGIVFACMMVRQLVFSAVRFQYQRMAAGRPSELFGNATLRLFEAPWPGGTTQDLLARMIQDVDLAGNSYWTEVDDQLVRLRPDWVTIVLEARLHRGGTLGHRRIGYLYEEGGSGSGNEPVPLMVDEVAHFAPQPDPLATYRGMSWLTPIVREIQADRLMGQHQRKFFENGATPNMVIKHDVGATQEKIERFAAAMKATNIGIGNAYKALNLYPGADATVVGADFKQIDFKVVRGHGETRIAAAAGVPPVIVGLSEGLEAATYCGTYNEAVWTTRGILKLGEVRSGDVVWSFVGDRLEPRKITWQGQTGTRPVYTIRTKNRTVRFTDNHPVLVRVPGNSLGSNASRTPRLEWRRVDELRVGDRVVQAQRLPDQGLTALPNGSPATVDVMQWLGAYTGDGCLSGRDAVRMCIPITDRARPYYAALALRLFTKHRTAIRPGKRADDGLTPEMVRLRAEGLTYKQIVEHMDLAMHPMSVRDRVKTVTRDFPAQTTPVVLAEARNSFRFHSTRALQWHHDMGVTGRATTKRVPGWIFELTEELRLAYLAGIVDTDGSVGKDGRLAIQFASRGLVEDVRMLLVSCGIACSNIADVEYKADVLPNPGLRATYQAWRFVASSAVEVGQIPFADPLYRQRVEANQHRHRPGGLDARKAGLHEDLGFYTIRSIELGPAEPVFDIEVEDGHSFLVDGVVVHNSNYAQARRRLADGTAHPLWQNVAGSLNMLRPTPTGVRLWYDTRDVPFLREDEKDAAEIAEMEARTIRTLVDGGYTPDSVQRAVLAGDYGLLSHSGLYSVQLQVAGAQATETTPTEPIPGDATQTTGDAA